MRGRALERVDDVLAVCRRWEVNATAIGEVTDSGRLRVLDGGEVVGDLPVTALVDECPAYDLEPLEADRAGLPGARAGPQRLARRRRHAARAAGQRQPRLPAVGVRAVRLRRRLAHRPPPRAGRRGGARCSSPAAPSRSRSTATAAGWRSTRTAARSRRCSSARPTSRASGAEPLGLTNCLNFGNPEKPHIAWQLTRAVAGLGDACRALGVPVVGGNVSLYNEGGEGPIYPTPVVGMVGELPDPARSGPAGLLVEGDVVALLARVVAASEVGSELAKLRGDSLEGRAPGRRPGRDQGAACRRAPGGALRRPAVGARRRRGRRGGRAGGVLHRGRPRRSGDLRRRRCSPRAPGRSSSPAPARRSRASAGPRSSSARSAATRSPSTARSRSRSTSSHASIATAWPRCCEPHRPHRRGRSGGGGAAGARRGGVPTSTGSSRPASARCSTRSRSTASTA